MTESYWVKGYPYKTYNKGIRGGWFVIRKFDSLKKAELYKNHVVHGVILDWGDGKKLRKAACQ